MAHVIRQWRGRRSLLFRRDKDIILRKRSTFCMTFRISENKSVFWMLWTNIELMDNKVHLKVYLFPERNLIPFLKMWKFCIFWNHVFYRITKLAVHLLKNYSTFTKLNLCRHVEKRCRIGVGWVILSLISYFAQNKLSKSAKSFYMYQK